MIRILCIGVLAPSLAILPFAFEVTPDPSEDEFIRSLWFGLVTAPIPILFGAPFQNEFARIPYGKHFIQKFVFLTVYHALVSCTFMYLNVSLSIVSNSYVSHSFPPSCIWNFNYSLRVPLCDCFVYCSCKSNLLWHEVDTSETSEDRRTSSSQS